MSEHYHQLPEGLPTIEPVALASLVRVSVTLLAAFGLSLTAEQIAAIVTFVEVVSLVLVRRKVIPLDHADLQAADAYNDGYDTATEEIASLEDSK